MDLGREQTHAIRQATAVAAAAKTPVSRHDMRVVMQSEREIDAIVNRMADFGREL
jgi:hypothetical protein